MITLTQLKNFLDKYMNYDPKIDARKLDEKNANGLLVKGNENISKIGFGVTSSLKFFQMAKAAGCQSLVMHHGLRWPDTPNYHKVFQRRYGYLIKNNLSLFAYHFLLDSHPEVGNNAQILTKLGVSKKKEYEISGTNWGWFGSLTRPQTLASIIRKCEKTFNQKPLVYKFGKDRIKTIAAISGSGSPRGRDLQNVLERDIDLFITGEVNEGTREKFRDIGANFIAGGHYATETLGVKALMKKVKAKFRNKVQVEYIELWNEV